MGTSVFHDVRKQQALELIDEGNILEAEALYRDLLAEGSEDPVVFANLASLRGMQGDLDELIVLLQKSLELRPDYVDAYINLGHAYRLTGHLRRAISCYERVVNLNPGQVDCYLELVRCYCVVGELSPVRHCFDMLLALRPNSDVICGLVEVLKGAGIADDAIQWFRQALDIIPCQPDVLLGLGILLLTQKRFEEAADACESALSFQPENVETCYQLGNAYFSLDRFHDAIASYDRALKLAPDRPDVLSNLGCALMECGCASAAAECFSSALLFDPDNAVLHFNLANALHGHGVLDEAGVAFSRAISLKPDFHQAIFNLSLIQLLKGDFQYGWAGYESRLSAEVDIGKPLVLPHLPLWKGESLSPGQRLILVAEQGIGDTIQFLRFVPQLRLRQIDACLCTPALLHSLVQASDVDVELMTPEQVHEIVQGFWLPLMSLPRLLGLDVHHSFYAQPYLSSPPNLIQLWHHRLASEHRPIIGLHWQGNPRAEVHLLRGRSLPLETLSPIASLGSTSFLSLQKGHGCEQLDVCSFRDQFVGSQSLIDQTWDFAETAAILANCDLIITTDSALAHLAGGMGIPTWLMLHKVPDWRWGLDGDRSFWYPSMRLFRQRQSGNWSEVVDRVVRSLQMHLHERID